MCRCGGPLELGKEPSILPREISFCKYAVMTSRWRLADCMFAVLEHSGAPYLKPTLNPVVRPVVIYRARAWSGCGSRAARHASTLRGVEIG